MKSYEQMARDVLKRRDEQLQNSTHKSHTVIFKRAVPCCAALAAVVVGIVILSKVNTRSMKTVEFVSNDLNSDFQEFRADNSSAVAANDAGVGGVDGDPNGYGFGGNPSGYSPAESGNALNKSAPQTEAEEILDEDDAKIEDTDDVAPLYESITYDSIEEPELGAEQVVGITAAGQAPDYADDEEEPMEEPMPDDIVINHIEKFYLPDDPDVSGSDFTPYTVEGLNDYYRIQFDALSEAHPDWKVEDGNFGIYTEDGNDGFIAWHKIVSTANTLHYVTPENAEIFVTAQHNAFPAPYTAIDTNEIGGTKSISTDGDDDTYITETSGYGAAASQPAISPPYDPAADTVDEEYIDDVVPDTTDFPYSLIDDGHIIYIYQDDNGNYLADLKLNSDLRIIAEGMSEDDFISVIRCFTKAAKEYVEPYDVPVAECPDDIEPIPE